jgi:trimethylamine--corrinoid protein Co-methyltransferase
MTRTRLFVQRERLMADDGLGRIEEAMLRVLEDAGIAVLDCDLRERLRELGFETRGNRVPIERGIVERWLEELRSENGRAFGTECVKEDTRDTSIKWYVNEYPQHVHDLETDRVVPFTAERLVKATKLLDAASDGDILRGPPGCPADVPGVLQPVVQYQVGATYSRSGRRPPDVRLPEHCPYMMEMAEVLGHPIESLAVWVASPLTLAGDSLNCVLQFQDRLSSVYVGSMPTLGGTAPVNIGDGFAVAAAEVVGPAILLQELLDMPVRWSVQLFPTDFASMAMVFGAPETVLLSLMASEVTAYLQGTRWGQGGGSCLTMAKLPGPQSCAEKASAMTAGALLGKRTFSAPGALSLDEVFSPEQFVYDLEIREHVETLLGGLDPDCDPERCIEEVMETLEERSFTGLESTARHCRDMWRPALFERSFLASWQTAGQPRMPQRARDRARRLIAEHDYRLEDDAKRGIDRIVERAEEDLA